jgi:hypothetical protein
LQFLFILIIAAYSCLRFITKSIWEFSIKADLNF